MKASTILTTMAAVLPATATSTGEFSGLAVRSGSPIHLSAINANGYNFWLGKPTSTYCPPEVSPNCPSGNSTLFSSGNSSLGLSVEVPGGQLAYVAADGAFGYTVPHGESAMGNISYDGFGYADNGLHLQYKGQDWLAVPVGNAYKVYAAAVDKAPKNGTGFAFRVQGVPAGTGAWEYD